MCWVLTHLWFSDSNLFDLQNNCNDNVAVCELPFNTVNGNEWPINWFFIRIDWGQNSYGAANSNDPANLQKSLAYYCQDDSIDVIPIAFLNKFFSVGGDPEINLANVSLKRGSVMNEYPFDSNGLFFNRLVTTWITLPSQELTLLIAPTLAVTSPFVSQKERSLPFL